MVAYTTTYNLKKPTVADDEDVWGGYLNDSMDIIDDVLDGTVPVTGIDINSGTLDNVVIGGATANSGTFTVLSATTSLGVTGNITVSGTVDGRDVAADGTKLDGIESGATADQTKADIDALGIAASTAATLATARNIALTGAVTGNVNFDGSGNVSITTTATSDPTITLTGAVTGSGTMTNLGNVSIATTATADPTLTLNGDVSGSATFTNLGNATLTATVANDSHTHDGRYYTESESDSRFMRANANTSTSGGITINGSVDSGATDMGYYQSAGTNLILKGDGSGRSGIFFQSEKDGTNINHTSDYGFIQFHSYGYGGSSGESNVLVLGVANDSTDTVVIQSPYNGGVKIGYRNSTSGTGLTLGTVWHSGNDGSGSGLDADNLDGYTWTSSGKNVRGTNIYADDWFRNYNSGEGIYNETTGAHWASEATGEWTARSSHTHSRILLKTNGSTHRGSVYANNSNEVGFLDSDSNWAIKHVRDSRTEFYVNNTEYMQLDSNGLYLYDGSLREDYDALSGTSPTCNINNGGAFSLTMTGNTTFTFSGGLNGMSNGFILQLTGNGSTVTWPSSVDWAGGTAPDAPASGETDIYVFWTRDGGTTWYGVQSIDAAA